MIVQADFIDHWKTQMLCDLLDDPSAPLFMIRIWGHCQNRKTSQLPTDNPSAIKAICKSDHDAKKLYDALLETGFLVHEKGFLVAHDWDDVNSSLIRNWSNGKKGGRPAKKTQAKPSDNPAVTQAKPSDNPEVTQTEPIREEKRRGEEIREDYYGGIVSTSEKANQINFEKPIRKDVMQRFKNISEELSLDLTPTMARGHVLKYLAYREDHDWKTASGKQVTDWEKDFDGWVHRLIADGKITAKGDK